MKKNTLNAIITITIVFCVFLLFCLNKIEDYFIWLKATLSITSALLSALICLLSSFKKKIVFATIISAVTFIVLYFKYAEEAIRWIEKSEEYVYERIFIGIASLAIISFFFNFKKSRKNE